MKILIVRPHASVLTSNSYNMQETGLAKAYIRAGHSADIVLYGGSMPDHVEEVEASHGALIRIYYLKGFGIAKNGFFFSLKRMLDDYDIIQVHEYDQITSWLCYTSPRLRGKVIIYHGPYYCDFNRGYNLRCKVFDNIFLRMKKGSNIPCFVKSNASVKFLKSKGFKSVKAVGVGLDTDAWNDCFDLVSDKGINGDNKPESEAGPFTFIYIGKLEPRRNILFLLDVVDRLLDAHDDINFIMIGDGEEDYKAKCLLKASKWIDAGRIKYIPRVSQQEIPSYYKEADCMLFPSIYEIFGMVLMEAIYFGVPVITSDNGGADMLFEDGINGIVIPMDESPEASGDSSAKINKLQTDYQGFDIDTWVDAATRIYRDRELRDRIKEHLYSDRDSLSWDIVAGKILDGITGN